MRQTCASCFKANSLFVYFFSTPWCTVHDFVTRINKFYGGIHRVLVILRSMLMSHILDVSLKNEYGHFFLSPPPLFFVALCPFNYAYWSWKKKKKSFALNFCKLFLFSTLNLILRHLVDIFDVESLIFLPDYGKAKRKGYASQILCNVSIR